MAQKSAFPPVSRMAIPTGPTGTLASHRKGRKDGGKRPPRKPGISAGARSMSRGR